MSAATAARAAMREVHLGIEADRLAIFARYGGEMRVGVFQRLEDRLGCAPERRMLFSFIG